MYFLPIIVTDNGNPPMSSTNTLTIRVCGCSKDGTVLSCNVEAYVLPIGLSMGALIAILACIVLLLGEVFFHPAELGSDQALLSGLQSKLDLLLPSLFSLSASLSF